MSQTLTVAGCGVLYLGVLAMLGAGMRHDRSVTALLGEDGLVWQPTTPTVTAVAAPLCMSCRRNPAEYQITIRGETDDVCGTCIIRPATEIEPIRKEIASHE